MRHVLLLAVCCSVAATSGCYKPWIVPHDKPIMIGPAEGLAALAVDSRSTQTQTLSVSLVLCRDANLATCIELGPVTRDQGAVVARLPAGRHCIMQLAFEAGDTGHLTSNEAKDAKCVEVEQGRIAYLGHLVLEVSAMGNTSYSRWRASWQDRSDVMRTMVDTSYPHLAHVPMARVAVDASALPDD
jgi:hypothetical protein